MTTIKEEILDLADQMSDKAKEFAQRSEERERFDDISFDLLKTFAENVATKLRKIVEHRGE